MSLIITIAQELWMNGHMKYKPGDVFILVGVLYLVTSVERSTYTCVGLFPDSRHGGLYIFENQYTDGHPVIFNILDVAGKIKEVLKDAKSD